MKLAKLALFATAMAVTPFAASAQDAGVTVYGNQDNQIATVVSNDGTTVVVSNGTHEAALPVAAFAEREIGWTIKIAKADFDAALAAQAAQAAEAQAAAQAQAEAEAAAKLDAALVVGAEVVTNDAQALGTISELLDGNVVVTNDNAGLITLPREFFAVDAEGQLMALASLETILAAVQGG